MAWCGGALAFLLFTAVPGTPLVRVERALVVGTATVVGLMVAMLVSVVRGWADGTPLRVGSVVAPMAMEP